MALTVFMVPTV